MNLIIEYFVPKNKQRHQEYLECLQQNIDNEFITKIHIFISDDSVLDIQSDKFIINKVDTRPTYEDLFEYCNENLKDEICIVANGDIIFTDKLSLINTISMENVFVALTRWELLFHENQWVAVPFNNWTSQDSWIFKSPIKTSEEMNFTMGLLGCDNRIAKLVYDQGYEIRNPGNELVNIHNHRTQYRTYTHERVPSPYLLVTPNADITKKTRLAEIDGYDEQGRPIVNKVII